MILQSTATVLILIFIVSWTIGTLIWWIEPLESAPINLQSILALASQITVVIYKVNDGLRLSMAPCCLYEAKFFMWSGRLLSIHFQPTFQPPLITMTMQLQRQLSAKYSGPQKKKNPCFFLLFPYKRLYSLPVSPPFEAPIVHLVTFPLIWETV